jgi:cobalamin biosynthesis Mg chelatase CobN
MTGAVLQALAVTGRAGSAAARRAVRYLRAGQAADGGFAQMTGRSANAQSTSYSIQGLVAVRAAPGAVARGIGYLSRLQRRDGSVSYSATSAQTPVWVTAQALAAMERTALPIAAVPRARPRPRSRGSGAESRAAKTRKPQTKARVEASPSRKRETERTDQASPSSEASEEKAADVSSAETATVPARPEEGATTAPATSRTRARNEVEAGGVSTLVVVIAGAAALGLLLAFRRRLRRA